MLNIYLKQNILYTVCSKVVQYGVYGVGVNPALFWSFCFVFFQKLLQWNFNNLSSQVPVHRSDALEYELY